MFLRQGSETEGGLPWISSEYPDQIEAVMRPLARKITGIVNWEGLDQIDHGPMVPDNERRTRIAEHRGSQLGDLVVLKSWSCSNNESTLKPRRPANRDAVLKSSSNKAD